MRVHEYAGRASRRIATALIAVAFPLGTLPAQLAADSGTARARAAFDFLIGSWSVVSRTDASGTTVASGETYTFTKGLNGVLIVGSWRFNRGSVAQPDVVDAAYYSGYDTRSRAWSFYYVSPQSAQYWPGAEADGRWYFTRSFTLGDTVFVQRQWWERVDAETVDRHVDNSPDGGRTWRPFTARLRRQR
jgi:hypothetical protein